MELFAVGSVQVWDAVTVSKAHLRSWLPMKLAERVWGIYCIHVSILIIEAGLCAHVAAEILHDKNNTLGSRGSRQERLKDKMDVGSKLERWGASSSYTFL